MIVGIDLGTTNSLVAVWSDGHAHVVPNALKHVLTPSVISVEDNGILIGEPALNRLATHPTLTIANFKRFMGSDKIFKLGELSFRAEELSALILKRLKEDAEHYLGQPVTEAIISVPAYFSDAQRKATKLAGQLAGLKVERLINEPTAAGIAYGLQQQMDDTNYLIIDLGGGTFDVSILSIFSGVIEVRASCGDNFLGGVDFTSILEKMILQHTCHQLNLDEKKLSTYLHQKIREQAEIAKHQLSIKSNSDIKIAHDGKILEFQCSEQEFEKNVEPLLQRLRDPIKRALTDANLTPSQIQQIVLVGGATRMQVVRKTVTRLFGKLPLCHMDPDTIIVQGVAIQTGLKTVDKTLDEIVVTDVCPYSLGVAVNSSTPGKPDIAHFDPIIERNTTIPVSRSRIYYPCSIDQKFVNIQIFQGENFFLDKNVFLGKFRIDLPNGLRDPQIEVRFTYDINGILEIEATIVETQTKQRLIIEKNPGSLSPEQIEEQFKKIKDIKIHPREKTENLFLISQAEKLYEELQGEKRSYLSQQIRLFIHVLDNQNENDIAEFRNQLKLLINQLQSELTLF